MTRSLLRILALAGAVACSASQSDPRGEASPTVDVDASTGEGEAGGPAEASASETAPLDAGSAPDGACASSFGSSLTPGFGRMDGVVFAVQKPSDKGCAFPNNTHVIVQVSIHGSVHRAAVSLLSTRAGSDPKMRYRTKSAPLIGPPFAEGWHTNVALDYVTHLGLHDEDGFVPKTKDEVIAEIASQVVVGAKVSIFSTSDKGRPDSSHLVHRNDPNEDGALVVDPTGSPKYLLFHFDGQDF